ncbi:SDR family NAD(P)-dependent oxidoreductase [Pontiellaceae bacterium B12227]|nr:SDR family NAD(P)-dependent oxidoreductase [Pontiellaceae bacterium B12227]
MKFHKKIIAVLRKIFTGERLVPVMISTVSSELLKGKTALVSGGSSGIGFGIAKKMADAGCKIILLGTNEERLKVCSEEINSKYLVLDIRKVSDIHFKLNTLTQSENIDILVNSAGMHGNEKFGEITENAWDDVIDVNLKGLYFLSQDVANHMKEKNINGHILNVSSASSLKPSWTPYEISKRAVDGITKGMAHKLIPYGITVNGLAPGPTATPMLRFETADKDIDLSWDGNPSKRVSTIEEIANLALFMVSGMGNGIVGDTVFMTGGSGTICIDK